jgi:hypothetical protein
VNVGLRHVKDGRFDLPDGRLSGVRPTFSPGRTTAVDPKPTSDALRRLRYEANGAFSFARPLDP